MKELECDCGPVPVAPSSWGRIKGRIARRPLERFQFQRDRSQHDLRRRLHRDRRLVRREPAVDVPRQTGGRGQDPLELAVEAHGAYRLIEGRHLHRLDLPCEVEQRRAEVLDEQ